MVDPSCSCDHTLLPRHCILGVTLYAESTLCNGLFSDGYSSFPLRHTEVVLTSALWRASQILFKFHGYLLFTSSLPCSPPVFHVHLQSSVFTNSIPCSPPVFSVFPSSIFCVPLQSSVFASSLLHSPPVFRVHLQSSVFTSSLPYSPPVFSVFTSSLFRVSSVVF